MPHFPNHLRDAFCEWVDDGMPPQAECEEQHEPVTWPAEKLLGRMCHCNDVMPSDLCSQLDLEVGSTYARGRSAASCGPEADASARR